MTTANLTTNETTEQPEVDERIAALAAHLECDVDDISEASYGDNQYDAEGGEYLVLTDSEADQRANDYIKDSLWAFNSSFLSGETGIDESVFEAIQNNGRCESNNDAIASCINDIEGFCESAISADGRGHFMSSYDGEESEQGDYFIYRVN